MPFDVWVDFMDQRPSRLGKNLVSVPRVGETVRLMSTDGTVSVAYEVLGVTHWLTDIGQQIHLLVPGEGQAAKVSEDNTTTKPPPSQPDVFYVGFDDMVRQIAREEILTYGITLEQEVAGHSATHLMASVLNKVNSLLSRRWRT